MKYLWSLLVAAGVVWFGWQQWQYFQSARPNYDHPDRTVQPSLVPKPGQSVTAHLVSAESGDTLTIQADGRWQQLRLCGINAPRLGQPGSEESRKYLQNKIDQVDGKLIFVPIQQDQQGRTEAEVFISAGSPQEPEEEVYLNHEMVAQGLASVSAQFVRDCSGGGAIVQAAESNQN